MTCVLSSQGTGKGVIKDDMTALLEHLYQRYLISGINVMHARDVMNTKLIYVTPSTSLKKVIQILIKSDISGVPVVNRAKHLVGIVTEEDLMLTWHYFNRKKTSIAIKDCHVYDAPLIIEKVITATEDTPVGEIIKTLIYKRIKRIPIVKEGTLVGIVSRRDILKHFLGEG